MKLETYQKELVRQITERKNLLVVAPMGSGKTLSTLVATATLIYREGIKNVIIIAPKRVAESVWQQENEKFNIGLNVRFCRTRTDLLLFMHEPLNHHVCVYSVTRIHEIPHGIWDGAILDESTLYGNKSSNRSKEARRICNRIKRRVLLTGTPIHGGYEKLWHQIFLLDGGKALGKTLTSFREKYMRVKYVAMGVVSVWEINPEMVQQLHDVIRHLVYVVKDANKMPPILYENIYIDLPTKRMKEYREFELESVLTFREESKSKYDTGGIKELIAFASSSRGMKLRQLSSGTVYIDEERKNYSITHNGKIDALKELRERFDGGILIAYQFKSELKEILKAFPKVRVINTVEDQDAWNAKEFDMAVAHPASVGHGLNLQFGGNVIVWYSPTYDAELYAQMNKRLDRRGQTEIVSSLHLVARGTIDEKIVKVITVKEETAENFNRL